MGRIVLFGATGYTGRLVAEALVANGARPLLAGRSRSSLDDLSLELGGGLDIAVADVGDPPSVHELLAPGDVMLSTVGPFSRWGAPAIEAAIAAGVPYLDSTGEPAFIRRVFEDWGPRAEGTGAALMTALGYDWVPGNLAGALALAEAGDAAVRVELGYFFTGGNTGAASASGGTKASLAGALLAPGFAFRDGRIVTEQGGRRVSSFEVNGKARKAVSIGSSEHFGLPQIHPGLNEVDAYLGWFGPASRAMQASSFALGALNRVPRAKDGLESAIGRFVKGSTGGPDPEARDAGGSHVVAIARDAGGRPLAEVHVEGVDGYTFTGRFLAWAAQLALAGGVANTGALGPAAAFGVEELERGVAQAGIHRV